MNFQHHLCPCSLFLSLLLAIVLGSCQQTAEKDSRESKANQHMHESDFDELINRFESPNREEWQKPDEVINKLEIAGGETIADIGAGSGYFSFRLAERGVKVIAKDVDERFIDYIKQKKITLNDTLVHPHLVKYDDPLMKTNEVDAVIIVNTYHHIENRIDYFKKVLSGIKAGGSLLVVDFKKEESPHGPPVEMRLSGLEVIKELQKVGFSKTIIETKTLEEQYIIKASKAEEI